jgi:AbrB family looped-hinge helix DNA binding protein
MDPVTLSPQFQLEVPREIREELGLQPGEQFQVINYGGRLQFIPVRPIKEMRGFLRGRGIDPTVEGDLAHGS